MNDLAGLGQTNLNNAAQTAQQMVSSAQASSKGMVVAGVGVLLGAGVLVSLLMKSDGGRRSDRYGDLPTWRPPVEEEKIPIRERRRERGDLENTMVPTQTGGSTTAPSFRRRSRAATPSFGRRSPGVDNTLFDA